MMAYHNFTFSTFTSSQQIIYLSNMAFRLK
jgi:hypothetical protein